MSTDLENNSYVYPCLELRSCQFPFENNSAVSGYMSVGFAPLDFRRKERRKSITCPIFVPPLTAEIDCRKALTQCNVCRVQKWSFKCWTFSQESNRCATSWSF